MKRYNLNTKLDLLTVVGGNIREARKSQRITIAELADKAGLSTKYLQSVETAKQNISITNLYKVTKALDIALNSLFINFDAVNMDDEDEEEVIEKPYILKQKENR